MSGWRRIESELGLVAAFFLSVTPWAVALIQALQLLAARQFGWTALLVAFSLAAMGTTIWVHRAAKRHLDRSMPRDPDCPPAHFPLALSMALQFPPCPPLSRLVLAIWWGLHFVGGAIAAHFIFVSLIQPARRGEPITFVILLLTQLSLTFAANLYLMLACGALWPLDGKLATIWRHRLLIDVAVVAAVTAFWR